MGYPSTTRCACWGRVLEARRIHRVGVAVAQYLRLGSRLARRDRLHRWRLPLQAMWTMRHIRRLPPRRRRPLPMCASMRRRVRIGVRR